MNYFYVIFVTKQTSKLVADPFLPSCYEGLWREMKYFTHNWKSENYIENDSTENKRKQNGAELAY